MLCENCHLREARVRLWLFVQLGPQRKDQTDFYAGQALCGRCRTGLTVDDIIDWQAWRATGLPGEPQLGYHLINPARHKDRFPGKALR